MPEPTQVDYTEAQAVMEAALASKPVSITCRQHEESGMIYPGSVLLDVSQLVTDGLQALAAAGLVVVPLYRDELTEDQHAHLRSIVTAYIAQMEAECSQAMFEVDNPYGAVSSLIALLAHTVSSLALQVEMDPLAYWQMMCERLAAGAAGLIEDGDDDGS